MTDRSQKVPTVAVVGTRGYPSYYGGFETAVRRLAPELASRGWKVRVYGRKGGTRPDDAGRDLRVESTLTPGIESKSLSTLTYGLTSVLHALVRKPDVALVMNVANGFWLPLLKLRGIPTIVNVDGIEWKRDKWSRLGKLVFYWGAKFTARFADELVFDAHAIGDYWKDEFGRGGTFIPYGGDPVADDADLPVEFPVGRYVLLVARFVPENSIAAFLDAVPTIIANGDVDVVMVGSAPSGDPLDTKAKEMAAANPRLHLLGHISDDRRLFALWQRAGVYFHGHTVGGTNPALVQAMALGSRIVASDTVYNREVLDDAGVVCRAEPTSISEAVVGVLKDERELGNRARDRAAKEYSWELVNGRYATLIESRI